MVFAPVWTAQVRRRLPSGLFFGFILTVGLLPKIGTSDTQMLFIIGAFGMIAAAVMLLSFFNTDKAKSVYGRDMLDYVFNPTPANSLMDSLEKSGVTPSDIKSVRLMASDLEHAKKYVNGGSEKFKALLDGYPDVLVEILGKADNAVQDNRVKFFNSKVKLTKHENLIETRDGAFLLWYEPYHDVIREMDIMPCGAYLFRIQSDKANKILGGFDALKTAS